MADEEVNFEEDEEMDTTKEGSSSAAPKRDAQNRKLKGRGATGSSTTMGDGKFESIESRGSSARGPCKCARVCTRRQREEQPCATFFHLNSSP